MAIVAASLVKNEAIWYEKTFIITAIVATKDTATTTQQVANRFAYSELSAPSMFPTSPDAENCTPKENIKIRPLILITPTCAANSVTPRIPANIIINSKAHHSRHMSAVVGIPSFMKVFHS